MSQEPTVSPRAQQIIDGLVRTGRGLKPRVQGEFVKLDTRNANSSYYVERDGDSLRRGRTLMEAEELQETFADAMARAGQPPSARHR
jgi:hypothetical protein